MFTKIFGYSSDDLRGQPFENLLSQSESNNVEGIQTYNSPIEAYLKTNNGDPIKCLISPYTQNTTSTSSQHLLQIAFTNPFEVPTEHPKYNIFENIFESAAVGLAVVGNGGRILNTNATFQNILSYSEAELKEMTFPEFTHPDDINKDVDQYLKLLDGEITDYQMEKRYITKAGDVRWVHLSVSLMKEKINGENPAVAIVKDIDLRKKVEIELENSKINLENSNKELQNFAYVASHDLQEPLRTIGSFLKLFRNSIDQPLNSESQSFLEIIENSSIRMRKLIDDLLQYSRVGSQETQFERVDMKGLIREIETDLTAQIEDDENNIELLQIIDVQGDRNKLYRLFKNLISNSLKFKKAGTITSIEIDSRVENSRVTYSVTDNGIGIDPSHQSRIFEIFKRLHTREEYEGSGIGLAICRKVVELHDGKIEVESVPDQKTTFRFDLPRI